MMKTCTRCQQSKTIDDFYGPIRPRCKACERELARWRMGRYENRVRTAWRDAKKTAKKFGVEDTLTLDDVAYVFALAGGRCSYTGKYAEKISLEHIIPMSRGGANALHNIVVVAKRINDAKKNNDPSEWLQMNVGYYVEADIVKLMAARRGVPLADLQDELYQAQVAYNRELSAKVYGKAAATG